MVTMVTRISPATCITYITYLTYLTARWATLLTSRRHYRDAQPPSRRQRIRLGVLLHVVPDAAERRGDIAAHLVDRRKIIGEIVDTQHVARLALGEAAACGEDHPSFDRDVASEQFDGRHAVVQRMLRVGEGVAPLLADGGPFQHLFATEHGAGQIE